jgi:hypothetical protein
MAIIYDTTEKTIEIDATATVLELYQDSMTVFAASAYMQYLLPMQGNVKSALYTLINGYTFLDDESWGFLTSSAVTTSSGDDIWCNVQTLGAIVAETTLYINQDGDITEAGDTGHIDQLLQVREDGSDVDSKNFTVYARKFQQTYSQFSTTGGAFISNVPLATAADPLLTESAEDLDLYADLTITWGAIKRSAFDGTSATKYTLDGAIDDDDDAVVVNEAINVGVPASGYLQIGSEVLAYSSWDTKTFTISGRGQYGTTAAAHADKANLSTNMKDYAILIKTSDSDRRLTELYNWVQYQLLSDGDIDEGASGKIGKITDALMSMPSATSALSAQGVWIEGFSSLDVNNIRQTDNDGTIHTPPAQILVSIATSASVNGGQVAVFALDTPGLTAETYTPANIDYTIINEEIASTTTSKTLTYSADIPVRIVVRKAGYQQFELFTTVGSTGLSATALNPADSAY